MGMLIKNVTNGFFFLCLISCINGAPYTKYGRSCDDIGCPSTQVCVMTTDQCNIGQRDGKECGRYPTCKRKDAGSVNQSPGVNLSPLPANTQFSQPSQRDSSSSHVNPSQNNNPSYGQPAQQPNWGQPQPQPQPFPPPNYQPPQNPQTNYNNPAQYPQPGYPQYPYPQYPQQGYPQNPQQGYPQYPQPGYQPAPKYNNPQQNNNGGWQAKEPSLIDQFLNNKRRNGSSSLYPSMLSTAFGLICLITVQMYQRLL